MSPSHVPSARKAASATTRPQVRLTWVSGDEGAWAWERLGVKVGRTPGAPVVYGSRLGSAS
jgi:hypothetical protein